MVVTNLEFPLINIESLLAKGIKGVLLDFDNTLYPYDPANEHALTDCYKRFADLDLGIDVETFKHNYIEARTEIHHELHGQAASHSRHLYFQRCFEKLFNKTNFDLSVEFEELYWRSFIPHMRPCSEAVDFLKLCKQHKLGTCIVTDLTARVQAKKLVALGLSQYLSFLVSSEEAGMEKPGDKIFKLAMRKLGLNPQQVIMIGDSQERDIAGAVNLGIEAYQVKVLHRAAA
jgi:putative hydrolase of the HAD superfamily